MRKYKWCTDSKRLQKLLDEGLHVICLDEHNDKLVFGQKIKDNEYLFGTRYVYPNGNPLTGVYFIDPDANYES